MNEALQLPGVSNAWTMPIKARIDMLTTGVRTPVGIKIYGADIKQIERIGTEIEGLLPKVHGTRNVFAERTGGGYFLDFDWKREEMARYGLTMEDVQGVLMSAVGGENVTTTIEGRERYPVNVRYMRDFRSDIDRLSRVLVPVMGGKTQIPISQLADIKLTSRPGHAARRERDAQRLRLRGRGRPRRGRLRGGGQERGPRAGEAAGRDTPSPGAASTRPCSGSGSGSWWSCP